MGTLAWLNASDFLRGFWNLLAVLAYLNGHIFIVVGLEWGSLPCTQFGRTFMGSVRLHFCALSQLRKCCYLIIAVNSAARVGVNALRRAAATQNCKGLVAIIEKSWFIDASFISLLIIVCDGIAFWTLDFFGWSAIKNLTLHLSTCVWLMLLS